MLLLPHVAVNPSEEPARVDFDPILGNPIIDAATII
jgi:hypothetical protein